MVFAGRTESRDDCINRFAGDDVVVYHRQYEPICFSKQYTMTDTFGVGTFLGVIGYIGAGFFNDLVVSVAPIFCVALGMGVGAKLLEPNFKRG